MKLWFALLLLAAPVLHAQDTVYKCRSGDGTMVFSDEPCEGAAIDEPTASAANETRTDEAANTNSDADASEERWCDAPARVWLSYDVFQENAAVALNDAQKMELDALLANLTDEGMIDTPLWRLGPDESLHFCASRKVGERIHGMLGKNGERRVVKRGFVKLMNDPETPLALRSRCVNAVQECMRGEKAVFDTCVAKMPSCSVREPWRDPEVCCPLECKQRYVRARDRDVPASSAFDYAIYERGGCIPGIEGGR